MADAKLPPFLERTPAGLVVVAGTAYPFAEFVREADPAAAADRFPALTLGTADRIRRWVKDHPADAVALAHAG